MRDFFVGINKGSTGRTYESGVMTLDLSDSMCRIVSMVFSKAKRVIDLPYTETGLRGCAGASCGTPLECLATKQRGNGRMQTLLFSFPMRARLQVKVAR